MRRHFDNVDFVRRLLKHQARLCGWHQIKRGKTHISALHPPVCHSASPFTFPESDFWLYNQRTFTSLCIFQSGPESNIPNLVSDSVAGICFCINVLKLDILSVIVCRFLYAFEPGDKWRQRAEQRGQERQMEQQRIN